MSIHPLSKLTRQSITGQHRDTRNRKTMHTHTLPKDNIEYLTDVTVMFLDCGRTMQYPERTHSCKGRTSKLHEKDPRQGLESRTFLLHDNSATNSATVQPGGRNLQIKINVTLLYL
ncbi:hypothetical protein AMECASPLE_035524 [Ameca splendens]|uniref:Uncharacterized protein n=1 Tax=Ameca splendens TaxID=208324 RepID=A0ABV0Y825_9TELE